MLKLIGLGGVDVFGIAVDYIAAGGLIALGIYVTGFLRFVGVGLVAAGVAIGAMAYGKTQGAVDCVSAARVAELEQQVALKDKDIEAWKRSAELRGEQLRELAKVKETANARIADWQDQVQKLSDAARRGRSATPDDDRRLCALIENRAPGCKPSGRLRPGEGRVSGDRSG